MRRKVFVLVYEHKHGMDLSVHASHDQAYSAVAEIARTWWGQDRADREAPDDCSGLSDQEVVDAYFEGNEVEFHRIDGHEVEFSD